MRVEAHGGAVIRSRGAARGPAAHATRKEERGGAVHI